MPTRRDPFHRVATGFTFLLTSALLPAYFLVALLGVFLLLAVTAALDGRFTDREIMAGFFTVLLAFPLTVYLLGIIGNLLLLAVPAESRASGLALGLVGLDLLLLSAAALRHVSYYWPALLDWQQVINGAEIALFLLSKGLFVLFVRQLGRYLDRPVLGRTMLSAALTLLLALVLGLVAFLLFLWEDGSTLIRTCIIAFGAVSVLVLLRGYGRYLWVLAHTRRAILGPEEARRRASPLRVAVAAAGVLLLLLGGTAMYLGWQQAAWLAEFQPEPQELTLAELLQRGWGTNRHVTVKGFRCCRGEIVERSHRFEESSVHTVWIPIIPTAGEEEPKGPRTPPGRLLAVVASTRIDSAGRARDDVWEYQRLEEQGYTGMVLNGRRTLAPQARQQLLALSPDTNVEELVLLETSTHAPRTDYHQPCLWGGGVVLGVGLVLFLGALLKPRRKSSL